MFSPLADTSLHVIISCTKVLLSLSQKIKSSQVVQTKKIGTNPMKITYYDNNKCLPTFSISSFFVYVLLALKVLPSLQAKKHKKKSKPIPQVLQAENICHLKPNGLS
jgi:hypothetical protein